MIFNGKAIKYGDNVDTDVIIPARYLNTIDKKEYYIQLNHLAVQEQLTYCKLTVLQLIPLVMEKNIQCTAFLLLM